PSQQDVTIVMEVSDDGRFDAPGAQTIHYVRHGLRRLVVVYRHADELATGCGERSYLGDRPLDIRGVRIGHGLHDDRMIAADPYAAHIHRHRTATPAAQRKLILH